MGDKKWIKTKFNKIVDSKFYKNYYELIYQNPDSVIDNVSINVSKDNVKIKDGVVYVKEWSEYKFSGI